MNAAKQKRRYGRAAFSMIEVLVASTILIVIVMMIAMLFQQTSVVWRTGLMRANGYMQLRSYIGAIQRDASAAIDARYLPPPLVAKNGKQEFTSQALSFYTLTGDGPAGRVDIANPSGVTPGRQLKFITHSTSGQRTERVLSLNGNGAWEKETSSDTLKMLTQTTQNDPTIDPQNFAFDPAAKSGALPAYILVTATITQKGQLFDVGAESAGPDGKWDTKDDIRTWAK